MRGSLSTPVGLELVVENYKTKLMTPYSFDDDPSGKQRRYKSSNASTPWGLLLLLLLSCSYALYSRQQSIVNGESGRRGITIQEPDEEEEDWHPGYDDHQQFPFRSTEEIQAMAEAAFNPKLHELYADLPPLPTITEGMTNVRK